MRKWVIPLLLLLAMLLPVSVLAQNSVSFDTMYIEIWPEYDKPSVLVIYQINFASSTAFPASVSIRIPTAAGEPYAVAEKQSDGALYTLNYTRQVSGEWASINFTTTSSEIQLEYYDPNLVINGTSRHYVYVWPGDYAIAQLTVQVQQPAGATDMRISPSLGSGQVGTGGLTYYSQDIGAISANQSFQITIDYQKSSDTLSAQSLPIEPSGSIPQSNLNNLNFSAVLPWLLGILGAGLIIGGSIWFWRSGKQRPATQPRRRRAKTSTSSTTDEAAGENSVYCSQCGKRASPGDLFCRSCGSPLRAR
jgi:hypothetical protein